MVTPPKPSALDPAADARLVERCLDGDARAWEALVRRHERLVYAVGRSWRLSDEDMGDVFQEVFAALVRSLPRLRDARTLVRWLSVTAERIARATALRRRREHALAVEDERGLEERPSDDAPIGADLELLERQALVRLAFGGLSDRCRRLLQALYYEDPVPAYAELSKRLGVPIGSLGPTRARCMERLKDLAAPLLDEPGISGGAAPTSGSESKPAAPRGRRARPQHDPDAETPR
ncbi:MAG: sigma-70 family RNA polymerase sigma factor [Candidatus Eisenbacteria bacterium]|uniref:Sigma-70 family RNA polymerase sigma factor n=1 Tax=Eiseniibacteriota bacterium TaxID=2212470 RepID=A0A933SDM4_UNCEI|nr:sigma-70 family RNA polymerase sigma factor [Candidatus Eisenbacteria bacterium]